MMEGKERVEALVKEDGWNLGTVKKKSNKQGLLEIEFEKLGKKMMIPETSVVPLGHFDKMWDEILKMFRRASDNGADISSALRQYIGSDACITSQFSQAITALRDVETYDVAFDDMSVTEVLLRQGLLDKSGTLVVYEKLQKHPQLESFFSQVEVIKTGDLELVFKNHAPITIAKINQVLEYVDSRMKTKSAEETKIIKSYFKGIKDVIKLVDFKALCGRLGLRGGVLGDMNPLDALESEIKSIIKIAFDNGISCRDFLESFDDNLSGKMTVNEFISGMKEIGSILDPELLIKLLKQKNFQGIESPVDYIPYRQFLTQMAPLMWEIKPSVENNNQARAAMAKLQSVVQHAQSNGTSLQQVFKQFDGNHDGHLSAAEFSRGLERLGIKISPSETKLVLRMFDGGDSNEPKIDFKSFCEAVASSKQENMSNQFKELKVFIVEKSRSIDWRTLFEESDPFLKDSLPLESFHILFTTQGLKMDISTFSLALVDFTVTASDKSKHVFYGKLMSSLNPDKWLHTPEELTDMDCTLMKLSEFIGNAVSNGIAYPEAFGHFDFSSDAALSAPELHTGLAKLGLVGHSTRTARLMLRHFQDICKQSQVTCRDFQSVVLYAVENLIPFRQKVAKKHDIDIREEMEKLDVDHSGVLPMSSLIHVLKLMQVTLPEDDPRIQTFCTDAETVHYKELMQSLMGPSLFNKVWYNHLVEEEDGNLKVGATWFENDGVERVLVQLCDLLRKAEAKRVTLEEAFEHFDRDKSGKITRKEFQKGLRNLGIEISSEDARVLMRRFESKGHKFIRVSAFIKMLRNRLDNKRDTTQLIEQLRALVNDARNGGVDFKQCFEHFDKDFSGTIDSEEFKNGLKKLGFDANEEESEVLMKTFGSKRHNGEISYGNFLVLVGAQDENLESARVFKKIQLALIKSSDRYIAIAELVAPYDKKKDGTLTRNQFVSMIESWAFGIHETDMHTLLRKLDPHTDDIIDVAEFIVMVQPLYKSERLFKAMKNLKKNVALKKISHHSFMTPFKHFDPACKGVVTSREFRCAIASLGIQVESMDLICELLDIRQNGKIVYEELVGLVLGMSQSSTLESPRGQIKSTVINNDVSRIDTLEIELQEFVTMAENLNIPLEETFSHFDKNRDGTIAFSEFLTSMLQLGFECTEAQLRELIERMLVKSGETVTDTRLINYDIFLRYWSSSRQEVQKVEDKRSDSQIQNEVNHLRREIKEFVADSTKRGITSSEVFQHFDKDGDGLITQSEFHIAIEELFDAACDSRVIKSFIESLDVSQDGMIDYEEFLGVRKTVDNTSKSKEVSTWQTVFSSRRQNRLRRDAESVALSVIQLIIRKVEVEVVRKGPIWQQVRKTLSARVNRASFIQHNQSAVNHKKITPSSTNTKVHESLNLEVGKESTATISVSIKQKMQVAEKLHAAEIAASRVAEESRVRSEQKARQQHLLAVEESALANGLEKLNGVIFFNSKSKAVTFLESIGLDRFGSRLCSKELHKEIYVFPVVRDEMMQQVLGTCSTIVGRKVKRELLSMLKSKSNADGDVETWTSHQVELFVADVLGEQATRLFQGMDIDGECLLELEVKELMEELGLEDEISAQKLVFNVAYLHSIAKSAGTENSSKVCSALKLQGKPLPRPSLSPVNEWSVYDVVSFLNSLELPSAEIVSLGVDGATLLELSDRDIESELGISNGPLLRTAIEAVRQPPYVSLGTGPYLDARIGADSSCAFDKSSSTCVKSAREHDVWIHIGQALSKTILIANKAATLRRKNDDAIQEPLNEDAGYSKSEIKAECRRIFDFVSKSIRAGLPVLATFQKEDKDANNLILLNDFEKCLKKIGFKIEDVGSFRTAVHSEMDKQSAGTLNYQHFFDSCMSESENHVLVFDQAASDPDIAFTTDGGMASLLFHRGHETNDELEGHVQVRYGGGSSMYRATIEADLGDGTYRVKYKDNKQVECVPHAWIVFKTPKSSFYNVEPKIAVARKRFQVGIHSWRTKLKHLSDDIVIGVKYGNNKMLGLSAGGNIVVKGFSPKVTNVILKKSFSSDKPLKSGDLINVRLDLNLMEICLSPVASEGKTDLLCKIRFDERSRETDFENSIGSIVKDFIFEHRSIVETQFPFRASIQKLCSFLFELGFDQCSTTQLTDVLEPFLESGFISTPWLLDDSNWSLASHAYNDYSPAVMLYGVGDCIQWDNSFGSDEAKESIIIGSNVSVRYGGGSTFYEGKVVAIDTLPSGQQSFAVKYEDGDFEAQVLPQNIQLNHIVEPESVKPAKQLVVKLYCRLLSYANPNKDSSMEVGVPSRGLSFCNVGNVRLTELLQTRLNDHHSVHWSQTMNTSHHIFAPVAANQNDKNNNGSKLLDQDWTLLGTIDARNADSVVRGDIGTPFTLRLNQVSDGFYHRLCFMAVLGTVDLKGCFVQLAAPVDPTQSVLESKSVSRIGGGFEFDLFGSLASQDEADHQASRFFLLSGPIFAVDEKHHQEQKHIKQKPEKKHFSKVERQSVRPKIPNPTIKNATRNHRSSHSQFESKRRNKMPDSSRGSSHDDIVFRRWLSLVNSRNQGSKYPLLFEKGEMIRSYDKVSSLYPSRPWIAESRKEGWLPSRHEAPTFQQWVQSTDFVAPSGYSNLTLYEHAVQAYADKPWILKSSNNEHDKQFSQDEKIVVDRWLAFNGLNEYGEPTDSIYGNKYSSPLVDPITGRKVRGRYEFIAGLHQSKPWLAFAESQGWLANPDEKQLIKKWAKKSGATRPERSNAQQTLFEALAHTYPSKPWISKKVDSRSLKSKPRSPRAKKTIPKEIPVKSSMKSPRISIIDLERNQRLLEAKLKNIVGHEVATTPSRPSSDDSTNALASDFIKGSVTRATELAQIQWEQQEQLRRLKQLNDQSTSLDKREMEIEKLKKEMETREKDQAWASRVTAAHKSTIKQVDPKDPWEMAVTNKQKAYIPL